MNSIQRLESKEWLLNIQITSNSNREISIICDKLILATGLTSTPNFPQLDSSPETKRITPVIHAKYIGDWVRQNLGYHPLPKLQQDHGTVQQESPSPRLRSVAIIGGAKSSFDLVHFFATLHRQDAKLHLDVISKEPIQIHWIIREKGTGPSWMAPPTSTLPNGEVVSSDKAASSRFFHYLDPYCNTTPKRMVFQKTTGGWFWSPHLEGSWWARLLHGNPLGRWLVRWFWGSLDRKLEELAQYNSDPKMRMLRPNHRYACR